GCSAYLLSPMNDWMRLRLSPVAHREARRKEQIHCGEDGPAVTSRASHPAQRVRETRTDDEDRKDFKEVRQRSRGLVGWCALGIEESAAVRAQHFDGFLRSHRPLANGLRAPFDGM